MITYKELEQLLVPIEDNQNPSKGNVGPSVNQSNSAEGKSNVFNLTLSHREIRKIPPILPFKQYRIQQLDLSFNFIKDIKIFREMPVQNLVYLNISFNFLTSIDKIGPNFTSLEVLDANANRITSVNLNDEEFPQLDALYLKNNKIKYFLHCPNSLSILCLDHNELERLAFTGGKNLQIISASHNRIQQFQFEMGESLNFIDLQENSISNMNKLKQVLQKCPNLLSINMIGNYVSKISHKKYLVEMLVLCPKVVKIDQVFINPHVREAFKIMNEEERMEIKMKETQEKYRKRMQEQLRLKEEMLDNLKEKEKQLEQNFAQFMKKQKDQLDALENYAKNNMGKKIMGINEQNRQFKDMSNKYNSQPLPPLFPKEQKTSDPKLDIGDQQDNSKKSPFQLGNELTQFLVEGLIISKHKDEYSEYLKNKKEERVSKQSKIKKYANNNIGGKQAEKLVQQQEDSFQDDQLTLEQKERRKKNMRNPGLVYRNSNQLIGAPLNMIDQDISDGEELVFNKKCLPYLVKNYGFHTVV